MRTKIAKIGYSSLALAAAFAATSAHADTKTATFDVKLTITKACTVTAGSASISIWAAILPSTPISRAAIRSP